MPKDTKVGLSFSNWILGGSLISVTSSEGSNVSVRAQRKPKRVTVEDVTDDDEPKLLKSKEEEKEKEKEKGKEDKGKEKEKDSDFEASKEGDDSSPNANKPKSEEKINQPEEKKSTDNKQEKGWTAAQDSKIKEMKGQNRSWKDIALEVGASKSDVQNRFKELRKEGEGESESGGAKEKGGKENGGKENRGKEKAGNDGDGEFEAFGGLFNDDDNDESGAKEKGQSKKKGKNSNPNNSGGSGKWKDNGKARCLDQNQDQNHHEQQNQWGGDQHQNQKHHEKYRHWEGDLPGGRLKPDYAWSREDCDVLDSLETRYREHKWLHMQAGFFNWTGRMVAAEIIEKKFRDDGAI